MEMRTIYAGATEGGQAMSKLTYKVEYSLRGTLITFNKRPPQMVRDQLESVGFKYNAQFRTWIGKKNTDKAVAIADAAVNRGMDVQYYGTLCWECANATGGCSWSKKFIPVEGWTAKRTTMTLGYNTGRPRKATSYVVKKCPEYTPDNLREAVMIDEECLLSETTSDPARVRE